MVKGDTMTDDRPALTATEEDLPMLVAAEDDPAGDFILKSQPKPEPRIILPTDALPKSDGPRKRIAAIAREL